MDLPRSSPSGNRGSPRPAIQGNRIWKPSSQDLNKTVSIIQIGIGIAVEIE
jgi:hypothetical protein